MVENNPSTRFLSSFEWTKERDGFGGYSAITLTSDGKDFVMMSDRGHLIEGSIFRHHERIIGVRSMEIAPLGIPDALFEEKPTKDSEGLARDQSGRLYVSLESENRIVRRGLDGVWSALPDHAEISTLHKNKGIEALAVSSDAAVYALPESSGGLQEPFPVYRFREDKGWDIALRITRSQGFLPVGADFGPDNRLYVLERGFSGFGFFNRVRRFSLTGKTIMSGETVLSTPTRKHDNLEGLSVWKTPLGDLRLTMVSDDNFNRFQKTEIAEYAVGN